MCCLPTLGRAGHRLVGMDVDVPHLGAYTGTCAADFELDSLLPTLGKRNPIRHLVDRSIRRPAEFDLTLGHTCGNKAQKSEAHQRFYMMPTP